MILTPKCYTFSLRSVWYFFHTCLIFFSEHTEAAGCQRCPFGLSPWFDQSFIAMRRQSTWDHCHRSPKEDHLLNLAPTDSYFFSIIHYPRAPLSAQRDKSRVAVNSNLVRRPHLGPGSIHSGNNDSERSVRRRCNRTHSRLRVCFFELPHDQMPPSCYFSWRGEATDEAHHCLSLDW